MMISFRRWLFISLSLSIATSIIPQARAGELSLALANSTCDAMNKVEALYTARHPVQITNICKSSGLLAKGLLGAAVKADVFVSADREWMDFAIENGLVAKDNITSPWSNALLVATANNSPIKHLEWQELASDQVTLILIGDPSTTPFGRYTKEALESSGLWDKVKHKIQTQKNVKLVAETLATSSPGTVGILFRSNMTNQLRKLHDVDKKLHKPIRYFMAPLKASTGNAEVTPFLEFMKSKAVQDIFHDEGFDVSAP